MQKTVSVSAHLIEQLLKADKVTVKDGNETYVLNPKHPIPDDAVLTDIGVKEADRTFILVFKSKTFENGMNIRVIAMENNQNRKE